MTSGGHANSGPAADPNALRRDRKDDRAWATLPREGFQGDIPAWPLELCTENERDFWDELWRRPQAVIWADLDLRYTVAQYVRTYLESVEPKAVNGLKNAVRSMEAELGLSIVGMNSLRWKFAEDELAAKRAETVRVTASERLKALNGAG